MTGRWSSRLLNVWQVALRDAKGIESVADAGLAGIGERHQAAFGRQRTLTKICSAAVQWRRIQRKDWARRCRHLGNVRAERQLSPTVTKRVKITLKVTRRLDGCGPRG